MAATAVPRRRSTPAQKAFSLAAAVTEWATHKKATKDIEKRMNDLRKDLMSYVDGHGEPDEKGSLWVEFDQPIAGISALKKERRVSVKMDTERAEEIARKKGIYDDVTDTVVTIDTDKMDLVIAALKKAGIYNDVVHTEQVLNDDKIYAAYHRKKITQKDLDAIFTEHVTWAFVPQSA